MNRFFYVNRLLSKIFIGSFLVVFIVSGCGSQSNLFTYLVPDVDRESFDYLYSKARAEFDAGELEKALVTSEKALRINRKSERASILYGFVNLALAGADPFNLAKVLLTEGSTPSQANLVSAAALELDALLIENQVDPLAKLKGAVGVRNEEVLQLGTMDLSIPDLPVLVPQCVETLRQEQKRLAHLNQSIIAICPFVDPEARVKEDYRQICEPTLIQRESQSEAHFLWSFAHLTEALIFHAVLNYRGDKSPESPSNLELRVARLKEQKQTDTKEFIESVSQVQKITDLVLPTAGTCGPKTPTSQLRATLTDLIAVERGFSRLPNTPPKMLDPLKKGISGLVQAGANAQRLRGDFTKKISQDLADKVDQLAAEKPLSAEDKSKLCGHVEALSTGNQILPNACRASTIRESY